MADIRRIYLVPARLEDEVAAELWAVGTLGLEIKPHDGERVRIEAYFAEASLAPDLSAVRLEDGEEIESIAEEPVVPVDWLARYRENARPFPVGRRLLLDPREPEEGPCEVPTGRLLLRLPARSAFGVGSHESTRLALELLEDLAEEGGLAGRSALEVGAGTAVLSFAALRFGARSAVAFDLDPGAPIHARDNSRLNGLFPRHFAGRLAALAAPPHPKSRFDLLLVNVLPEEILAELPDLVERLAPGGELIFSGILAERGVEILGQVTALGLVERGRRIANEWIAFRLVRAADAT
ncbi:MAG TPA: 50S ribosomal protein L11 methyltransferase [Thermoanaerobaculia bacterium]|jgi:ribosomal protein L11 methyltransferase|nr:50S ribosomal protein L11 methyltransferase [Thermoanaerobaculia bacterium]